MMVHRLDLVTHVLPGSTIVRTCPAAWPLAGKASRLPALADPRWQGRSRYRSFLSRTGRLRQQRGPL